VSVLHVECVADVFVALAAVDAAELARDLSTERVGVSVRQPRAVLYGEIKLAQEINPSGLLPDEVFGGRKVR